MALYCIGDVQGCNAALGQLLDEIGYSPSRDRIVLLGDLVNRGPDSLGVLRRLQRLEGAATCLLGNHDLHLLAVAAGVQPVRRGDTIGDILEAADRSRLIEWLARQSLAHFERETLMVHAGVLPQWTVTDTLACAAEVESVLRSPARPEFLRDMYGNDPRRWSPELQGIERLRVVVNALTRLRFCSRDGTMEFETKEGADAAPPGYLPWFDIPERRTRDVAVAFGHWSTLGWLDRRDVLALDSGCVWGGQLTAVRLSEDPRDRERITVRCPQAQNPRAVRADPGGNDAGRTPLNRPA